MIAIQQYIQLPFYDTKKWFSLVFLSNLFCTIITEIIHSDIFSDIISWKHHKVSLMTNTLYHNNVIINLSVLGYRNIFQIFCKDDVLTCTSQKNEYSMMQNVPWVRSYQLIPVCSYACLQMCIHMHIHTRSN